MAHLRETLLRWYAACRRDLPWRRTRDPYAIWVSEIMLQQTRVETVIPYYQRFLARFPTVHALAEAPEGDVLAAWSGLGYYRRARYLHKGAQTVARVGAVPSTREALLDVPGIGRYTAGAIASIAWGERVGLVDGNVARVLSRLFLIEDDMKKAGMRRAEILADAIVSPDDPGGFNQALMELGATVCTPRSPRCDECPAAASCRAHAAGRAESLPNLSAKNAPKTSREIAFVIHRKAEVLLMRRGAAGTFAGLWEPPRVAKKAAAAASEALGVDEVRPVGRIVHVLSHRRLVVDVVVAAAPKRLAATLRPLAPDYEEAKLVSVAKLDEIAVATLTRKILRAAGIDD